MAWQRLCKSRRLLSVSVLEEKICMCVCVRAPMHACMRMLACVRVRMQVPGEARIGHRSPENGVTGSCEALTVGYRVSSGPLQEHLDFHHPSQPSISIFTGVVCGYRRQEEQIGRKS